MKREDSGWIEKNSRENGRETAGRKEKDREEKNREEETDREETADREERDREEAEWEEADREENDLKENDLKENDLTEKRSKDKRSKAKEKTDRNEKDKAGKTGQRDRKRKLKPGRTGTRDRKTREKHRTGKKPFILAVLAGAAMLAVFFLLLRGRSPAPEENENTGKTEAETEMIPETSAESYGVFLGVDSQSFSIADFEGYDVIVIDAQELSSRQLMQLHLTGHTVYSYLNVGSVEKSRDYFERFEDYFIGRYDNWPDEVWVDVTQEEWQEFVSDELLCLIQEKDPEIDGLFLDNIDIYSRISDMEDEDMTSDAFDSLVGILETYQEERLPVIINGADLFVDRLIEEGKSGLIKGVNQETVFTRITNYSMDWFGKQKRKERDMYISYLERCKEAGLDIFLLEYTTDDSLKKEIEEYCRKNDYRYYISGHVDLGFADR